MKKLALLLSLFVFGAGYAQSQFKLKAQIQNRNSDSLFVMSRTMKQVLTNNGDGNFEASFDAQPGLYQLFDGEEYALLYLKNDYDLTVNLDADKFDESIKFTGKGAEANNYLAMKMLDDEVFMENIEDSDEKPRDASKIVKERTEKLLSALEASKADDDFKELMKKYISAEEKQLAAVVQRTMVAQKMKGKKSPGFEYENHKGGTTKLSDLKGKYVYIDVWATWCGPCRREIPYLKEVEEKYHGKDIAFVSISVDKQKDHAKWENFVDKNALGGIQLMADKDWSSDFIKIYDIHSIPRFILIDPQGKVVDSDAPRPSDPKLQQVLDKRLK
ncbi:hypothetical protein GCM10007424_19680 [Flavobacterium suaedae]|uniref:Thioredoxin domain-containing protein n=1 Tax=Flavobacterium suaedae TaxID=1767027 RepID=A0ABQ1K049_9FLAO|nr:TlpA disulfide reductase family protein [Flavobacterium suaedae]GGB79581.1 hypothetical protein GCM10007424_19680 [Flavobacterium suaedae]